MTDTTNNVSKGYVVILGLSLGLNIFFTVRDLIEWKRSKVVTTKLLSREPPSSPPTEDDVHYA